jgi:hypothetical protein
MVHVARSLAAIVMLVGVAAAPAPAPVFQAGGVPGLLAEIWTNYTTTATQPPTAPATAPNVTQNNLTVNYMDSGPRAGMQLFTGFAPLDNFFIRWRGYVQAPATGTITFQTISDDGCALSVNGTMIINDWAFHGPVTTNGNATLTMGQWYPIELLFFEGGVTCEITLNWTYPGQATPILIPSTALNQNPPPPPVPTLTISTPQSFTPVINLSWTASAGATGYNILRGFTSGSETQYATVTAPTTTYSDTNVVFGQMYFYVVQAVNGPSASANSNEVSGMPQPIPPRTGQNQRSDCGCASTGAPGWATIAAGLAALSLLLATARRT